MEYAWAPGAPGEEDVTYACEYCRRKYNSYGEAEACEAACRAAGSFGMQQPAMHGAPPNLANLLSGGKGALIGKGLQLLAAKGVLPGLLKAARPPQPAQPAQVAQPPGERNGSDKPTDPFLKEVQSFMDRWDLETRFEPKLVTYLKRNGALPLKEELARLDQELRQAGVPPVCRSGYLLVVFGEVSEKSTDEDFRYLLTGRKGDGMRDDSPPPEKPKVKEEGDASERQKERGVQPLPESWMMEEIDASCTRFKLEEAVRIRLVNAMRSRQATFKEDMRTLNDVMRAAKHPKGAVQLKLREIERGTFSARSYSPLGPTPAEKQDMERAKEERRKRSRSRSK